MKTSAASLAAFALAAACFALVLPAAQGQMIYWDPGHTGPTTTPNGSGGSGTWDTTTANWYQSSSSPPDSAYSNGGDPFFSGAAGTVTLNVSGLRATDLFFITAGYVVQDAAGTTYALTTDTVTTSFGSGTATVNAPLTFLSNPQLRTAAGSTLALNGTITTASAVTVGVSGGAGTASLAGNNSFSAGINVAYGMLTAASNTALGTGNVTLAAGTTLTLNAGIRLSNQSAATLTLSSATSSTVNLLGSGVQDTVAALTINGLPQLPGTYGAAGSGADFTPADFLGTGELQVVPEPETWALLGVGTGTLALAARRRMVRAA